MKVPVYSVNGEKVSEVELPVQFSEPVREDLIKRAVLAVRSRAYQPQGSDPEAGMKQGKALSKHRQANITAYGRGISRIARKLLWKRGSQWYGVGARAASVVKGRKQFHPKVEKITVEKINKKENRKAIRSAMAVAKSLVIENKFEDLKKSKEVVDVLRKLKLENELERVKEKKVRAGRGKMRGRRYRRKIGPLIVTSEACPLARSAKNIPGVDVVEVKALNAELLAPGTKPGRLTVWTQAAVEKLSKEGLFV